MIASLEHPVAIKQILAYLDVQDVREIPQSVQSDEFLVKRVHRQTTDVVA